ncbi:MAG: substrate-binding domain-containing protein [Fusicatenibacter sp.]|nr:substrate-binding domain-containing protein [Fusicatenibacter sp.]
MKRKVIAVTLTAMMAVGMFAGCGTDTKDSADNTGAVSTQEASGAQETEKNSSSDDASNESQAAAGNDFSGAISVISREDGSGTRGAFIELFGVEEKNESGEKVDNTTVDAQITNNTSVMMSTVAGNEYAIGYISLGSLNESVKALQIDGADASAENVENGSYKVSRPFNIITKDGLSADAQDFVDFILSTEGQEVVSENGYIPLKDTKNYAGSCSGEKVVVAGSSSVTPVMEKLKEAYAAINSNANIEVQQSDSTTGVTSTSDGLCDIGMASRELKDSEAELGLTSTVIATDGIAVIVNNENPIDGLTSEQVKSIFVGETTDWADVQ